MGVLKSQRTHYDFLQKTLYLLVVICLVDCSFPVVRFILTDERFSRQPRFDHLLKPLILSDVG